jgi:Na+-transporting methylmalonyl-CoA/oxaloacetate decarboxylase gamma subunit
MDAQIGEGLRVMAVGILGVFANLALLALIVSLFGAVLGKKKPQKKKEEPQNAGIAG